MTKVTFFLAIAVEFCLQSNPIIHLMKLEQLYTGCLAHGAYFVASNGEAALIDPLREIQPYLDMAAREQVTIKYVFETHFHADFVSGHLDLAKATGAEIVYGPTAQPGFPATVAAHGQKFPLGKAVFEVLHTPGHTMESSCFLLHDESGKPSALFTGDTLFIGDVGRPDLAQKVIAELTQEKLASHLYDSIHQVLMPLPDDLVVYPGHGAGSACGKNMSDATTDTFGNQKATNYALQPMTREEFVRAVLDGLMPPPAYFPKNVLMNITGYSPVAEVLNRGTRPLDVDLFAQKQRDGALVIDTRRAETFGAGFVPGSFNIGIDGNFATWVGTLVRDIQQPLLLVTDPGREEEVVTRLARVGYDQAQGFLAGGFEAWKASGRPVHTIDVCTPHALEHALFTDPNTKVVDVRKASEFRSEHLVQAVNAPLDYINESSKQLDPMMPYFLVCAGGYRSMVYASLLKARGFNHLISVSGGMAAVKKDTSLARTEFVPQTTQL